MLTLSIIMHILEVERDDSMNVYEDDEQAVEAAVADGIRIIPVDELPESFDRRYYGWIDTPENRRAIQRYCDQYRDHPKSCVNLQSSVE